ncbi:MAG: hypothetical protein M1133_00535 [Armatimonadetes bacterium]|nr:hypothetical protein [Armatimonadota bacterium]
MRRLFSLLCVFGLAVVVGCGGSGGGGAVTTSATTPTVDLSVPSGAAPAGVSPTVTYKTATEVPGSPTGSAFVSAAQTAPAGTAFTQPVTLTFTLTSPLGATDNVDLFQVDANGTWTNGVTGATVPTVSTDRLTVTVQVSSFSAQGYYALFKL